MTINLDEIFDLRALEKSTEFEIFKNIFKDFGESDSTFPKNSIEEMNNALKSANDRPIITVPMPEETVSQPKPRLRTGSEGDVNAIQYDVRSPCYFCRINSNRA